MIVLRWAINDHRSPGFKIWKRMYKISIRITCRRFPGFRDWVSAKQNLRSDTGSLRRLRSRIAQPDRSLSYAFFTKTVNTDQTSRVRCQVRVFPGCTCHCICLALLCPAHLFLQDIRESHAYTFHTKRISAATSSFCGKLLLVDNGAGRYKEGSQSWSNCTLKLYVGEGKLTNDRNRVSG